MSLHQIRTISRRVGGCPREVFLLLSALTAFVTACRSAAPPTEQWTPPYLQLSLRAGKAQVQWANTSKWETMEGEASIAIRERGHIVADAADGAQFHLGDDSTLELDPETVIEVQSPLTFPRLQVVLLSGSLTFIAQKPSYELNTPICPVRLLSVPSHVVIEVNGAETHLAVKEGGVTCELETETLTLPGCWEMRSRLGEEPEVTQYCTPTPIPSLTPLGFELTPTTSTPSPTATSTPTPTITQTPTPTYTPTPPPPPTDTPLPPTEPPPPPPLPPPPPPPTEPPPPPPTEPPPPPPTEPPPTEPPPPPPTEPPARPTPTP